MKSNENRAYIIAEIGGNHEGDFAYAKKLLRLAIESGADAVKFQVYTGETLVNKDVDPARAEHFSRFALDEQQYFDLAKICLDRGVDFLASVWTASMIEKFSDLMPFFKVGSGDLTAFPILRRIAMTGKPILLSTGLSTFDEIDDAIRFIREVDSCYSNLGSLGVLQCTSMYPIPDGEANLKVMEVLKQKYPDLAIGYSDHTVGSTASKIALAAGAEIIEIHFTDTRAGKEFRDHQVSFTCEEVKDLVQWANKVNVFIGDGKKEPTDSELKSGHLRSFRRALYPARALLKGEYIRQDDLVALRPCVGISACKLNSIVGRRANRDYSELEPLDLSLCPND